MCMTVIVATLSDILVLASYPISIGISLYGSFY